MFQEVLKWLRVTYKKVITSIAFLPAIIALFFLLLSFVMIAFDFSDSGKRIKASLHWLSLRDASTARSICSAITSGIISLAVFSFSMVMILLNQAASQMSNRILGKLIGNRFQQFVLGFYIGTIVYALFLLSTIRDINSGIYVPAISTYLLIALTITDIFLFIYFLHYITESVKYETIIQRIHDSTKTTLLKNCTLNKNFAKPYAVDGDKMLNAHKSGLYQGFDRNHLLRLCVKENAVISFLYPVGTYVLCGTPIAAITNESASSKYFMEQLPIAINIDQRQNTDTSYYYGFSQLMEIAIRALSPGINDPGTAVVALQAIADLLAHRIQYSPETFLNDDEGIVRIVAAEKSFEQIFKESVLPIWDYGKADRLVQQKMLHLLLQLQTKGNFKIVNTLIDDVQLNIKKLDQS